MALLQILKVKAPGKEANSPEREYYFQGGSVYKDSGITAETGISVVEDFENDEPLVTIEQLVLSKKIMRLTAELETTIAGKKKRKTATLYVSRNKAAGLLGGNKLNGKEFNILSNGNTKSLGKIKDVRTSTRDSFN